MLIKGFLVLIAAMVVPIVYLFLPARAESAGKVTEGETQSPLLMAHARSFLERKAKLRPGESVLILGDRSGDEVVRGSLYQAAREMGATVHELVLQGHPEITDGFEIARQMRFRMWWPEWIWSAASGADIILQMGSFGGAHLPVERPIPARTRLVPVPFANRLQLADPRSRGNYPEEILETIAQVVWQQMRGGREIHLSDPQGTDLKWTLDPSAWTDAEKNYPNRDPTHLAMPAPFRSRRPDMRGWIVGSSTHSGPIPLQRLRVEAGRVVEVIGGGHMGDYLRAKFAEYASIQYPEFAAPGASWVEETALGTHPAYSRTPGAEHVGWWGEMHGWIGAPRAGVFHVAVGTSNSGRTFQFVQQRGLEVQHWDIELYAPTLAIDGRMIINRGHLLALDDSAVRQVAARYGKAEELLKVVWMPRVN